MSRNPGTNRPNSSLTESGKANESNNILYESTVYLKAKKANSKFTFTFSWSVFQE